MIDEKKLIEELNRLKKELIENGENTMFEQGRISAFEDAIVFINTLEVKEVDLEKEMTDYFETMELNEFEYIFETTHNKIAKHFFELALKAAQKGEEV